MDADTVDSSIAAKFSAPILYYLRMPEIEEIAINRPEEIWLRLRKPNDEGEIWECHRDTKLTRSFLTNLIYALANIGNQGNFGKGPGELPVTYGVFPGGHRYAAGIGPNFQYVSGTNDPNGTIVMSARQYKPDAGVQLGDLGLKRGVQLDMMSVKAKRKFDEADPIARLLGSLRRGDHILISGATSTGKTTLMNNLIKMLKMNLRVLTVEDTSELSVPQPNHYHILMNRSGQSNAMTYKDVVDLLVRSTPDIILAGEISTKNAATIWELMRSGHGHFMTTIHAESVDEALETFVTRISHEAPGEVADRQRVVEHMREKLRIIQMNQVEEPDPENPNIIRRVRRITAIT
jgi:type IV secretion system protein VirB11